MNKSKIEWCDYTWNPVTGCLHGCEYCYARRIAERFKSHNPEDIDTYKLAKEKGLMVTNHSKQPYPVGFHPTFHPARLDEPQKLKKPSKIFVCSMADLFGEWVPDEWIEDVFKVCEEAPQHTYLFLTKNPERYLRLEAHCKLPKNHWYGTTMTNERKAHSLTGAPFTANRFLSIEPLLEPIHSSIIMDYNWVIIGAETGNRKDKIIPKREWIIDIVKQCMDAGVPVFLKDSLKEIMGYDIKPLQEFPEGM